MKIWVYAEDINFITHKIIDGYKVIINFKKQKSFIYGFTNSFKYIWFNLIYKIFNRVIFKNNKDKQ